ncbi:DUF4232 domain-containing protein [Streptomyces sp. XD-27]|uniref:DUF4232 domain-containing protein n=1 Tax=Streptomyces sp. XD-27 TaxID=3062779 RepID=UPI0026F4498C|nr:DUF4232 domain-containing protein [Streptomyces sp. XD-27]WKX71720.1 DUF4232 domain-containing protein [Streptomyces sp. XD-27]
MNHKNHRPGAEDPDRRHDHDHAPPETAGPGTPPETAGAAEPDDAGVPDDVGVPETAATDAGAGVPDEPDELDELALRRLLRGAVDDIDPSPDALDHLRRAVPARRTRRRQALVGAAAAVVFGGAAMPALVHVATTGNASDDRPANAASSERTPGVQGGAHGEGSDGKETGKPSRPEDREKGDKGRHDKDKADKDEDPKDDSSGPGPNPSGTLSATSPVCTRAQLGDGGASAGAADANGHVYGSFRVVNVSSAACTVDGAGAVSPVAQGSADGTRIAVVDHTAGDAAAQLPDPSTTTNQLILQPGQAYEVKFAWIPAAGGGTTGCSSAGASPTPDPTPDGGTGAPPQEEPATGGETDTTGGTGDGGGQPDASVLLNYTPAIGAPATASTVLSSACAGTVYRTGLLAG